MTIATLAAPQPFFSCFTKGTSSQTDGAAARRQVLISSTINAGLETGRSIGLVSADGHDDQNQRGDRDQDDNQVAVCEVARREVGLRLAGTSSQLREFAVA